MKEEMKEEKKDDTKSLLKLTINHSKTSSRNRKSNMSLSGSMSYLNAKKRIERMLTHPITSKNRPTSYFSLT